MLHKNITVGDVHYIQQWEVADSTARNALSVTASDVGKIARQLDTNVWYILTDDSPITWQEIGSGGSVNSFSTITVSGQSNVVADSSTDTLTLVAGTNVTITTDAGTDSITINASGTSPIGKQTIWIPASAMSARTTNGAASGTSESTTNKIMQLSLDFDQTTQEFAQFNVAFPKSWNESTVTAQFFWTAASGSGAVVWGLQGVAVSNDDVIDVAFGTAQEVSDTLIATGDLHLTSETSAITIGGTPADGDLTFFQVYRDPADVADTLTGDAKLLGVKLYYTTDSVNDA